MSELKESTINTDKITGRLPETKLGYTRSSSQTGYESVYGSSQRHIGHSRRLGWFQDARKNYPQLLSMAAATFIFASGGMNLASSIGFGSLNFYGTHVQVSWFIAVVIGSAMTSLFVERISKRIFNLVASVLVIISGIFYITATQNTSATATARYCDGIAFGLTLIPTIIGGSEQTVMRWRGFVLSVEQIGLAIGAIVKLLFIDNMNPKENVTHGKITLLFGVAALICTFAFTLESPVFLLLKDFEDEAIIVLRKLQKPFKPASRETYALLNESKALLEEDMNIESSDHISRSWIPMIKIILLRSFVALSISFPLTLTFNLAVSQSSRNRISVDSYTYILMRLIGVIFSTFFLDTVGRRIPSALSMFFGGGILFTVGWLLSNNWTIPNAYIQAVVFLMLIYQLLSGISAACSTCYLSEAFPVSVKPYFILSAIVCENVIHILVNCLVTNKSLSSFAFTLGGAQFFYAFIYFFIMPETKETTLREALNMFQRILAFKNEPNEDEEYQTDV